VVTLGEYRDFRAVGQYYDEFGQVTDDEVRERLERAHRAAAGR
jgi:predicted phosphoribosyltransferase